MFQVVRLTLAFVLGAAAAQAIQDSPQGAFLMGATSAALTLWMIIDIARFVQGVGL